MESGLGPGYDLGFGLGLKNLWSKNSVKKFRVENIGLKFSGFDLSSVYIDTFLSPRHLAVVKLAILKILNLMIRESKQLVKFQNLDASLVLLLAH